MLVIVDESTSDIYPTHKEVQTFCRPGEGADTCIWLVYGAKGFKCTYYNKLSGPYVQWLEGKTVAKRDGCNYVAELDIGSLNFGKNEVYPLT